MPRPRLDLPLRDTYVIEEERVTDGRLGASEWKILGFGLVAAIVVYWLPFTRSCFPRW